MSGPCCWLYRHHCSDEFCAKGFIGEMTGFNQCGDSNLLTAFLMDYLCSIYSVISFRIFAFMMGVEWVETLQVGSLLGQKTVINEFVAYLDLSGMKASGMLNDKSLIIATFLALWIFQFQLYCHPDRRYRRDGAQPPG
jgi:hypothetical protein